MTATPAAASATQDPAAYTADEMMTACAARALRDGMTCFVGIGLPSAAANLARATHAPNLVLIYESGTIGAKPDRLPLSIGDGILAETADAVVSVPEIFNYWLQPGRIDVGFLGAAQLDRFGNINTVVVGDQAKPKVRGPGTVGISALCGLAKRLEEVWLPDEDDPVVLPRSSEGLYLLQRVRDEAHRFAITYQRQKRAKRLTAGALDTVPGLGESRRQALLKHFGSLKRLRAATVEEICEVPGVGRRTAEAVVAALAVRRPAAPAVNTATGEILEEPSDQVTRASESGKPQPVPGVDTNDEMDEMSETGEPT